FLFHILLAGEFRVGVSRQLLIRAIAQVAGVEPALIAHRLAGNWTPDDQTMARLLGGAEGGTTDPGMPYPFMLAHPLHEPLESIGPIADWLVEWKWDGIRAQIIRRAGRTTLWSRGDEVVTATFPEITQAATSLPDGTVLDGEIVAWDDAAARPQPFTKLQRRLNRKSFEMTFWPENPVTFVAFDALEIEGADVRGRPLRERRELLARVVKAVHPTTALRLSEPAVHEVWDAVSAVMKDSRRLGGEGVMLKRWDSPYTPGRTTGLWWKLKVEPYTTDVVMIAAEPGHGKRAGLLTDYTFGVWDGPALVPITKAYSGLTDQEIAEVDRFARKHTLARHGPVHAVAPLLVFEIGFEAIQASGRHKSGIALRFPRILRVRKDKKPEEADRLQAMRELLEKVEAGR
ncbi:MAG: ligase, ATP-dependent, partial [Phycisphaerales bacterium]|nr:ligase, ATP-dependent [Phycisphaerales bacterium]